jgi:hypothetical protein
MDSNHNSNGGISRSSPSPIMNRPQNEVFSHSNKDLFEHEKQNAQTLNTNFKFSNSVGLPLTPSCNLSREPVGPPPTAVFGGLGHVQCSSGRHEPTGPPPTASFQSVLTSSTGVNSGANTSSVFSPTKTAFTPMSIRGIKEHSISPPVEALIPSKEPSGTPLSSITGKIEPKGPPPPQPSRKRLLENCDNVYRHQIEVHENQQNQIEAEVEEEEEEEDEEGSGFQYIPPTFASQYEIDPQRLKQRQKQLDMGKNTIGYQNYTEKVSKSVRQFGNKIHPTTPDIHEKISKRNFDGRIKAWRRQLHFWDVLPGQRVTQEVVLPHAKRMRLGAPRTTSKDDDTMIVEATKLDTVAAAPDEKLGKNVSIFDDFDL